MSYFSAIARGMCATESSGTILPAVTRFHWMCRYENNTTFFQLVDVPNATKFVVTFDSQSRTEAGYV